MGGPPKIWENPPKSSILIGFSIIFTIHFGFFPPIFGNIHIFLCVRFLRLFDFDIYHITPCVTKPLWNPWGFSVDKLRGGLTADKEFLQKAEFSKREGRRCFVDDEFCFR